MARRRMSNYCSCSSEPVRPQAILPGGLDGGRHAALLFPPGPNPGTRSRGKLPSAGGGGPNLGKIAGGHVPGTAGHESCRTQSNLADLPPENQKLILAKVRVYESMKPDPANCGSRRPSCVITSAVMNSPATNRPAQLLWSPNASARLSPLACGPGTNSHPAQQGTPRQRSGYPVLHPMADGSPTVAGISPGPAHKAESGIRNWQVLPKTTPEDHTRSINSSNYRRGKGEGPQHFERTRAPPNRKTLDKFKNLTPAQRDQCIRAFEKFARFGLRERHEFLKNAERWKQMRPNERQDWRELVNRCPIPALAARIGSSDQAVARVRTIGGSWPCSPTLRCLQPSVGYPGRIRRNLDNAAPF